MGYDVLGYLTADVIRKTAGSPAEWFIFSGAYHSLMMDNLGSNAVFFKVGSVADTGSMTGLLPVGQQRVFDIRGGSISVMGSNATTNEVQMVMLRN